MNKRALSVTLGAENVLWLRTQARATRRRSVSDFLDRLLSEARTSGKTWAGAARSVVGSVRIEGSDPGLTRADAAVQALFRASLGGPAARRAKVPPRRSRRATASAKRRRG